jgi:predicted nucleic acid-binding protein
MKELFAALPSIEISNERCHNYTLLDTCFFINTFEHQKESKLRDVMKQHQIAMTSFNVNEFLFKEHVVDERVRENVRRFLKKNPAMTIININVHPGDREGEKYFVKSIDPELLKEVPDASDALLIAAAIKTQSIVLTRDKHHLFTTKLENYLRKYDLKVYKDFHELY